MEDNKVFHNRHLFSEPPSKRRKIAQRHSSTPATNPTEEFLAEFVVQALPCHINKVVMPNRQTTTASAQTPSPKQRRAVRFSDSFGDFGDDDSDNIGPSSSGTNRGIATGAVVSSSDPSENLLMDWNGHKMDRYDIRALLESSTLKKRPLPASDASSLSGIYSAEDLEDEEFADIDRYVDIFMDEHRKSMPKDKIEDEKRRAAEAKGAYNAVTFSYGTDITEPPAPAAPSFPPPPPPPPPPALESEQIDAAAPVPSPAPAAPEEWKLPFETPRGMAIPKDEKMYQIIQRTADFIKAAPSAPPAIQKIRESQAANPNFKFIQADDELFPFLEFLLKTDQQRQQAIILAKVEPKFVRLNASDDVPAPGYTVEVRPPPEAPKQLPSEAQQRFIQKFVKLYMTQNGGDDFVDAVRKFFITDPRVKPKEKLFSFLRSSNPAYSYFRYYAYEELGINLAEKDPEQRQADAAAEEAERKKAERRAKAKAFMASQLAAKEKAELKDAPDQAK